MKRMYLGIGIALGISLVALTGYAMQGSGSKLIGEEKAEQIALEDAGADRQDTVMETTTLEYDRGQYVYDVEFTCGGFEYDYDIRAGDGAILSSSREEKDSERQQGIDYQEALRAEKEENGEQEEKQELLARKGEAEVQEPERGDGKASYIGVEEAKAIALEDAGLSEEEVIMEKARFEKDDDDDPPVYEIEFTAEGREYEYSIHAVSGAVLEKEAETDDD